MASKKAIIKCIQNAPHLCRTRGIPVVPPAFTAGRYLPGEALRSLCRKVDNRDSRSCPPPPLELFHPPAPCADCSSVTAARPEIPSNPVPRPWRLVPNNSTKSASFPLPHGGPPGSRCAQLQEIRDPLGLTRKTLFPFGAHKLGGGGESPASAVHPAQSFPEIRCFHQVPSQPCPHLTLFPLVPKIECPIGSRG